MKTLLGFLMGTVAGLILAVLLITGIWAARAQGEGLPLLPDVREIYRSALTAPFQQVEGEIHDPDIANFYRKLMEETGLLSLGK